MNKKAKVILDPYSEPLYDGTQIDLLRGFRYFNYHNDVKDAHKWVVEWAKSKKYSKSHMSAIRAYSFTMTIGTLCRMMLNGTPEDGIVDKVKYAIEKAKEVYQPPKKAKVVHIENAKSIQERMVENVRLFCGEHVELEIDDMYINKGKSTFSMSKLLDKHNVAGKWATMIADMYKDELKDIETVLSLTKKKKTDEEEQLLQAYPQKKAELKRIHKFFNMLVSDAEHHAAKKKAGRKPRAKKTVSTQKMVEKVQYKVEDADLKLVSESPSKIIGAKEVWLYNTKYRKLIQVFAEDADMGGVFSIKGTTIQGVGKSEMKTLRKPEVTLKEFGKAGKVKLRKFMDGINAKATPFTGRLNKDIIILKVIK